MSSSEIVLSKSEEKREPRKRKVFIKPSLEDLQAYCRERGNGIHAQEFLDYYDQVGWVVGKSRKPMVDWKAAVREWETRRKKDKGSMFSGLQEFLNRGGP